MLGMMGEARGAQPGQPPGIAEREAQRQRERERQRLLGIQESRPDVRLQPEAPAPVRLEYPEDESPVFLIREIRLEGDLSEKFQLGAAEG